MRALPDSWSTSNNTIKTYTNAWCVFLNIAQIKMHAYQPLCGKRRQATVFIYGVTHNSIRIGQSPQTDSVFGFTSTSWLTNVKNNQNTRSEAEITHASLWIFSYVALCDVDRRNLCLHWMPHHVRLIWRQENYFILFMENDIGVERIVHFYRIFFRASTRFVRTIYSVVKNKLLHFML